MSGLPAKGQPFEDGGVALVLHEDFQAGAHDRQNHDVELGRAADDQPHRGAHRTEIGAEIVMTLAATSSRTMKRSSQRE